MPLPIHEGGCSSPSPNERIALLASPLQGGRGEERPILFDTTADRQPFPQYYHSKKKKTAVVHSVDLRVDWETTRMASLEPLQTRGWAFQEWILSRRIAHFSQGELLWECSEKQACECQVAMANRPSKYGTCDRESASLWMEYVEGFTHRQLTYVSDRLPAMAGVARLSQRLREPGDLYIAGHWKSELPSTLLWKVDSNFDRPKTASAKTTPRRGRGRLFLDPSAPSTAAPRILPLSAPSVMPILESQLRPTHSDPLDAHP